GYVTTVASALSLLFCGQLIEATGSSCSIRLAGLLNVDSLSVLFILIVNVVALAASWSTIHYLEAFPREPLRFHLLFNFFHFTILLVLVVDTLVLLWIALELPTLASAFLMAHSGRAEAVEAAWKYIILTSTGFVFALFGTVLLVAPADPGMPS